MNDTNRERPAVRRGWVTFSLRTLAIVVLICALAAGWWTQRGRWWRYCLANGADAHEIWPQLLKLNGIENPNLPSDEPIDVWSGSRDQSHNGWVWVRSRRALRPVTPSGRVLGEGGIVVDGDSPEVLWNSTLPDGRAAIVLFNNAENEERYLIMIAARDYPVVHLIVDVEPGVTAWLIGNDSPSIVELKSSDGSITEAFSCDAESLAKPREKAPIGGSLPWSVKLSR